MSEGFLTTRWSLLAAAARHEPRAGGPDDARAALGELCAAAWPPLYAHARRSGASPEEAADLVQGFLARLIESGDLADVDRSRGRFRSWLLAAFRHYRSNERDRGRALRRGGGRPLVSIDAAGAERDLADVLHPVDRETPERAFDRRWALMLLERAMGRLRAEQARIGKQGAFDALRPLLAAEDDAPRQADVAARLGTSEGALRVALHRLRRRFGELLREEVAETVDSPAGIEAEIGDLRKALARPRPGA